MANNRTLQFTAFLTAFTSLYYNPEVKAILNTIDKKLNTDRETLDNYSSLLLNDKQTSGTTETLEKTKHLLNNLYQMYNSFVDILSPLYENDPAYKDFIKEQENNQLMQLISYNNYINYSDDSFINIEFLENFLSDFLTVYSIMPGKLTNKTITEFFNNPATIRLLNNYIAVNAIHEKETYYWWNIYNPSSAVSSDIIERHNTNIAKLTLHYGTSVFPLHLLVYILSLKCKDALILIPYYKIGITDMLEAIGINTLNFYNQYTQHVYTYYKAYNLCDLYDYPRCSLILSNIFTDTDDLYDCAKNYFGDKMSKLVDNETVDALRIKHIEEPVFTLVNRISDYMQSINFIKNILKSLDDNSSVVQVQKLIMAIMIYAAKLESEQNQIVINTANFNLLKLIRTHIPLNNLNLNTRNNKMSSCKFSCKSMLNNNTNDKTNNDINLLNLTLTSYCNNYKTKPDFNKSLYNTKHESYYIHQRLTNCNNIIYEYIKQNPSVTYEDLGSIIFDDNITAVSLIESVKLLLTTINDFYLQRFYISDIVKYKKAIDEYFKYDSNELNATNGVSSQISSISLKAQAVLQHITILLCNYIPKKLTERTFTKFINNEHTRWLNNQEIMFNYNMTDENNNSSNLSAKFVIPLLSLQHLLFLMSIINNDTIMLIPGLNVTSMLYNNGLNNLKFFINTPVEIQNSLKLFNVDDNVNAYIKSVKCIQGLLNSNEEFIELNLSNISLQYIMAEHIKSGVSEDNNIDKEWTSNVLKEIIQYELLKADGQNLYQPFGRKARKLARKEGVYLETIFQNNYSSDSDSIAESSEELDIEDMVESIMESEIYNSNVLSSNTVTLNMEKNENGISDILYVKKSGDESFCTAVDYTELGDNIIIQISNQNWKRIWS